MKNIVIAIGIAALLLSVVSCAPQYSQDRYNTQRGAAIGAAVGATYGGVIGRDVEGVLIGSGVGTLLGAIIGNAVDQSHQAAREAAMTNKRIVYYDNQGGAIEAIPGPSEKQQTNCRKITKRVWDNGRLTSETVEEICEGEKRTRDY
jgi:uncharacterized protein YcfJ